jgi:hypothetical protein
MDVKEAYYIVYCHCPSFYHSTIDRDPWLAFTDEELPITIGQQAIRASVMSKFPTRGIMHCPERSCAFTRQDIDNLTESGIKKHFFYETVLWASKSQRNRIERYLMFELLK